MKKRFIILSYCILMLAFFLAGMSSAGQKPLEINFPTVLYPDGATAAMEKFAEMVKERSNGAITVNLYTGGAMGGERDLLEALTIGSVDLVCGGSMGPSLYAKEYEIINMPYVFRDQEHLRKFYSLPIGQKMWEVIQQRGKFLTIAIQNRGPRMLYSRKKIIRKPEDLQGFKLRLPEIPIWVDTWQALGATTVPIAWPEVFMALQTGIADGVEADIEPFIAQKLYEVTHYCMLTGHIRSCFPWHASEKFWNKLDENQKKIILEAAKEATAWGDKREEETSGERFEFIKKEGMEIIKVDIKPFQDLAGKVVKKYEKDWPRNIYRDLRNIK